MAVPQPARPPPRAASMSLSAPTGVSASMSDGNVTAEPIVWMDPTSVTVVLVSMAGCTPPGIVSFVPFTQWGCVQSTQRPLLVRDGAQNAYRVNPGSVAPTGAPSTRKTHENNNNSEVVNR